MLYHLITFYWINLQNIQALNYMFIMFLTPTPSFVSIKCDLPFDLKAHILCTILNAKTEDLNT